MEANAVTGPAKNLIEFARQAARAVPPAQRVELSILTFQRGPLDPPNAFVAAARSAGIQVDVIRERRAFDLGVIPQLKAILRERRPDIVQSHNPKSHLLIRLTGIARRHCWIAFLHGYTTTDLKVRVYNQVDRWSLRGARRVVTVCEPFAEQLRRMGVRPERIAVQHNMVKPFLPAPPERVEELRQRLGVEPGVLVILCAGRLSREKGHLDLMEALGKLRGEDLPAFRLILAGEGPERARIERKRRELGLDCVTLVGYQQDLVPFYSLANMAALPSHSEGSPNALLEALAAGLPVVATAVGGAPEIARDEVDALLTARGDIEGMAAAIARLLRDVELRERLGARGREVTRARTPEAYCQSILRIYADAAGEAR
jgi:glycosyltransferase involved in cell wall biosynthesis